MALICKPPPQAEPGPLKPRGPTVAAAFRRTSIAIPSWQTAAAAGCASCSQSYRNGPDVSANANYTFYVCADQTTCTANEWGGTSFAAPMWAGYLALVNQQSVANGNKLAGIHQSQPVYDWCRFELHHGLPRHHERKQWLLGHNRLRSGNRVGQPEWERTDQLARWDLVCSRDHQSSAEQHVDLGLDHLHLECRDGCKRLLSLGRHHSRRL